MDKEIRKMPPGRRPARRGQLQTRQRNMCMVQVQRRDAGWIGGEVTENVAAARGYGDEMITRLNAQRLHVNHRIFPDLRIDQPVKSCGEHALAHARQRESGIAVHRLAKPGTRRPAYCLILSKHCGHDHLSIKIILGGM